MRQSFLLFIVLAAQLAAQGATPGGQTATPEVTVPVFANKTCPIMGKPASSVLFAETANGRIYVCCPPCNKKILADVEPSYNAAYPRLIKVENLVCPVTGEKLKEDSPKVIVQGREIGVCCSQCQKEVRENAQIALVKASNPKVRDLQNENCPVSGLPVAKNAFCLIGDDLVRLSSPECVEWVKKDPREVLEKVRRQKQEKDERKKDGPEKKGEGGKVPR